MMMMMMMMMKYMSLKAKAKHLTLNGKYKAEVPGFSA